MTEPDKMNNTTAAIEPPAEKKRFWKKIDKKKMFWTWIIYQSIKGSLTTSLIWAPMIYCYFNECLK